MSPRCAVLVSGTGTILEAIVTAGVPVSLVVADRPCGGLDVATSAGIPTVLVDRLAFGGFSSAFDREGFTRALVTCLRDHDIALVAMAGFGTVVTAPLHEEFSGRVLNTHPSWLPDFKGWHAVRDALASGARQTGCTVHVATEELDDGPILAQVRVEITPDDDEASLHERIKRVERELYPLVITKVVAALERGEAPATVRLTPEGA